MSAPVRTIDAGILPALARGCSVLGAGGGGDTYTGLLASLQAIEQHGPVAVVDLDDLPDDGLIMPCGYIGAPTVSIEKLGCGSEGERLRDGLEALTGRRVVAVMAAEIGGANGLQPVGWAARMGLPVADADGMGRAFPEVPQVTMEIAGIAPAPSVMTDERGNTLTLRAVDGAWTERLARAVAVECGGRASSTEYIMTAAQARTATVRGSVSLAARIGAAVAGADDPLQALMAEVSGRVLITGKVTDVERRVTGGFVRGSAQIEGLGDDSGSGLRLEIQNENLVAIQSPRYRVHEPGLYKSSSCEGTRRPEICKGRARVPGTDLLATVPDIITVLDSETAHAVHTERLRYGQRVSVVAFPCDPIWRTPRGLELAGPRAFGYDLDYIPVEQL